MINRNNKIERESYISMESRKRMKSVEAMHINDRCIDHKLITTKRKQNKERIFFATQK